ncbi:MAG: hydantoinase B/oxoprolinase family protein, partial [Pseudomonadota bacterium]|nr:hydantoinase B/oxoprolinase family protein [Pseudomonadota bacterium]
MSSVTGVSSIRNQIMWNRLISVVEEQAQTLVRTAFSTSVREAGDLAAAVFDNQGRMLAQAVTGTPGHINAMAEAIVHFIAKYPVDAMEPGDVYITNDPWKTSGHLHDVTVVTPTFHGGRVVGLFANTCHVVDIGGRGFGPDANQVFEEGVNIPVMHLFRKGEVNEVLMDILQTNVREPRQVIGDIYAFAGANDIGSERLVRMLDEFGEDNLDTLSEFILENSRLATIERISKLRNGRYSNSVTMDGYDQPVTLAAELTVGDDYIHVDYGGTSPASNFGINVVLNYTKAYTCFGVKCAVAPDIPNNYGSLLPITFSAPEGCILNVQRPFAVAARHIIGHLLPDTVLGCLHQVLDSGCQAEGSASLWNVQLRGGPAVEGAADFDGEIPTFDL